MVCGWPIGMDSSGVGCSPAHDKGSPPLDLELMLADRAQWSVVAQLIKSEQIPPDRMADIAREHPEFWATHVDGNAL